MSKLYAVKLKPTPSIIRGNADVGYHTTLTKQGVIDLISKKGIGQVEWIGHDDKNPVNQHQLDKDLLQIWKGVQAKKINQDATQ